MLGVKPLRQSGVWEAPAPEAMIAGRQLMLSGWVAGGNRDPVRLVVLRDGVPAAQAVVPGLTPGAAGRPDRTRAEWAVALATSDDDAGATIEIAAFHRGRRTSLGTRRLRRLLRPQPKHTPVTGSIDVPRSGDTVLAGAAMLVEGWVLFDGRPAESIAAFVGDNRSVGLRNHMPRLDVWKAMSPQPGADPRSMAAGFSDLVPVPGDWGGQDLSLIIRARSLDGQEWTSDPVAVKVAPEFRSREALDRGSPFLGIGGVRAAMTALRDTEPTDSPRVCVFTHSLRLGGGELYLQELVLRLARHHDCRILVVSPEDGPLKDQLREAGVDVHLSGHFAVEPSHYLAGVAQLKTLLDAWQADAVIVNTLGAFPGVDAGLEAGLPVIWAIHESFALETFAFLNWGREGLHPAVHTRWLRCLTSASTVFESEATLDLFRDQVPGLNGSVVRYGIDLAVISAYREGRDRQCERARLGFAPDELVLLCMGVMQERKAQLALALAFAEVAEAHPGARLVMVGDHPSPYAAAVRELVEQLGMAGRISLEPIQPDTYQWYLAADVMVSASDTESLARSVLEAMAFGRPVLAADVFGLSEVIRDGENGWLCRARSGASLVAGLKRVLTCDPAELRAMSSRCETDSQAFDGAGYASEYAAMIRASAGRRHRPERQM